jgi:hypothetical protein
MGKQSTRSLLLVSTDLAVPNLGDRILPCAQAARMAEKGTKKRFWNVQKRTRSAFAQGLRDRRASGISVTASFGDVL